MQLLLSRRNAIRVEKDKQHRYKNEMKKAGEEGLTSCKGDEENEPDMEEGKL